MPERGFSQTGIGKGIQIRCHSFEELHSGTIIVLKDGKQEPLCIGFGMTAGIRQHLGFPEHPVQSRCHAAVAGGGSVSFSDQLDDLLVQTGFCDAGSREDLRCGIGLLPEQSEQVMLGTDIGMPQLSGEVHGSIE
jgi:hypothetical protein